MMLRLREVARLIGLLVALPCAAAAQRGAVAGRITIRGTDLAISYAVVATQSPRHELFSESDGAFLIRDLPAGRIRLSAKRIGYAPLDTTVDIVAGDTVHLALELTLVTAQLPPIHSLAQRCSHPGDTSAALSLELASLFEQVKQNADRHRLLARSYPFELVVERMITKPEPVLEARFVAFDTVRVSSAREWRYAPGKMMGTREYGAGVFAGKWMTITMPELADFADEVFLDNHCFDYGGLDQVDGDSLLRIEFIPASKVHEPDVAGTLFLDPRTYQIRLTMMSVVNPNKQMQKVTGGQAIRAAFREVIPGVPVLDVVSSVVFAKDDPKAAPVEPSTETQRTLSVKFLKGRP